MSKNILANIDEMFKFIRVKKSTWKRLLLKRIEFDTPTMDKTINVLIEKAEEKK